MDVKQYISSGILELYVLGLLDDPDQVAEVERYALEYPEIRAEIFGIEIALEAYAEANSKPIDMALMSPLLLSLGQSNRPPINSGTSTPPSPAPSTGTTSAVAPPKRPLTESEKSTRGGGSNWLGWLAAGMLALLAAYFYFSHQSTTTRLTDERADLQSQLTALEDDCATTNRALANAQQQIAAITNAATQDIILAGTDNAPNSRAIVFYNQDLQQTFFRATDLPAPPAGKQYQLWGIDGEGPKSLGVLALDLAGNTIIDVPYLPSVGTFAITLEDAGGKPTPDLSQIQVAGATS